MCTKGRTEASQGLGGGEKNGMEGMVVGMLGIEGMLGNGGNVTLGRVGILGILGNGGRVGIGKDGCVVGRVGIVGCGSDGIVGRGGKFGICKRLRAARPMSMLENANAMKKAINKYLQQAISLFT
ncbi:hypothetical protein HS088_TW08G00520 [Tripterygium wilfordii]|uniref:Uncharacterized protein n=1 Tax=Tripterygium wilfordii TaxID=458696 RepID=A0A7J7DC45_TRIWF|nr:uncharacterized protein LOC120003539 [Tripterygium wilfordii]KAF5743932.1 hypothetical protein HS088_TW08G00520 [Tripterygium wilfordii]